MPRSQPRAAASAPPCAQTRAASEDQLLDAARRYVGWFQAGGTTTIEAKSGYGLTLEDECKIAARDRAYCKIFARVPTFLARTKSRTNIGAARRRIPIW